MCYCKHQQILAFGDGWINSKYPITESVSRSVSNCQVCKLVFCDGCWMSEYADIHVDTGVLVLVWHGTEEWHSAARRRVSSYARPLPHCVSVYLYLYLCICIWIFVWHGTGEWHSAARRQVSTLILHSSVAALRLFGLAGSFMWWC